MTSFILRSATARRKPILIWSIGTLTQLQDLFYLPSGLENSSWCFQQGSTVLNPLGVLIWGMWNPLGLTDESNFICLGTRSAVWTKVQTADLANGSCLANGIPSVVDKKQRGESGFSSMFNSKDIKLWHTQINCPSMTEVKADDSLRQPIFE